MDCIDRSTGVPIDDRNRIAELEERLAPACESGLPTGGAPQTALAELEMLADLYMQADSYVPALETIERLLALPASQTLSPARRAARRGCVKGSGTPSRRILRKVTSTTSAREYRSRMLAMALRTSTINNRNPQCASSGHEHFL